LLSRISAACTSVREAGATGALIVGSETVAVRTGRDLVSDTDLDLVRMFRLFLAEFEGELAVAELLMKLNIELDFFECEGVTEVLVYVSVSLMFMSINRCSLKQSLKLMSLIILLDFILLNSFLD